MGPVPEGLRAHRLVGSHVGALLERLDREHEGVVVEQDRRRLTRAAAGAAPTGPADAQAFFEAVNDALPGDAMVSIDVSASAEAVAADVVGLVRGTDRLLVVPTAVRFYLPGDGEDGIRSLLQRVSDVGAVTLDGRPVFVVVEDGEHGADAFDRLKRAGGEGQSAGR